MKNIDFSNIELSFSERITIDFFQIINSNSFIRYQRVVYLNGLGLLDGDQGVYSVNRYCKMYFRIKRKERVRFIIPAAISTVALFAGYDVYKIPLLDEILSTVKTLLIHIMESLGIFR